MRRAQSAMIVWKEVRAKKKMMLISSGGDSTIYNRPAPVFIADERPLSTKKSRSTPKFAPPPRAPVKSCPVTRIFSRVNETDRDRPQPVSFKEDSDFSFIVHSPVYCAEKTALYFEQCFVIEERLGVGSFGEVFKVRSKEDGRFYACKRTLLRYRGEGDRRRRMAEVQKHEKLPKHKNCVEFYRAWEERQHLYLLTEVCSTSLANVADARHDLPESVVWNYLVDLLQGVRHLHKHNLVHMDIKPENIFFGYDGLCKLGDFGLVIDLSQGGELEALEGDPKYLAPEILESKFGPPADIYSLGMTILELATDLDLPRQGEPWQRLRMGELPPAASHLSDELKVVLIGLLNPNPEKRLTADQALTLAPVKRVLFYKYIQDYLRKMVLKARAVMIQTWMYIYFMLMIVSCPLRRLQASKTTEESPDHSKMSDSDFASGYSDDEGLDQSLAHPLSDISSSSSEALHYRSRPFGNSTPIGHHAKHPKEVFGHSPITRNSFNASPGKDQTPSFLRCRRTPHSGRLFGAKSNESKDAASMFDDTPSPLKIPVDEEQFESVILTSRNLIHDLINAADSDDE
ncbi:Protein kinase, membrane associated tyrosine threonine 1 [Halocaridina rubra]|uniref:Membrane-associated tyrosine- and threonine-specific cdc2-inhibitory kinase n=1 Tax=Halocaridina rubra TaxID=373956 RepID=A0AAN8ZV40_HALRR